MGFTAGSAALFGADFSGVAAAGATGAYGGALASGAAGSLLGGAGIGLGTSFLASRLMGGRRPVIPPSPQMPADQVDQSVQNANEAAMRRESIAGGLQSTIGTPGGGSGQMLNPANMGGKTLLGQ
jgi:hypothetical protein